jgi:hypothetical protein
MTLHKIELNDRMDIKHLRNRARDCQVVYGLKLGQAVGEASHTCKVCGPDCCGVNSGVQEDRSRNSQSFLLG